MDDLRRKNRRMLRAMLVFAAAMVALCFASAPLYRLTCQITGWSGTTQKAAANTAAKVLDREMTVRFDTNVQPGMPWTFRAEQGPETVHVGADGFASFLALNTSDRPVTGTAVYNVTPLKAGRYFVKTQCFCFSRQTLRPGQRVHMPVVFHIDPKIADDPNMDDVRTVTLSYTFYREDSHQLESAIERFYDDHNAPEPASRKL
jgi:cytochrome c oxidase assembly protein subunit 11